MDFECSTINSYETVAEITAHQEETLESIVPDACPDILRIVNVCGQATLTSKYAREGAAQVAGTIQAYILYQPEGGSGLRRMEVSLPFSCQVEASGLTEQGVVIASPRLCKADARALNPRKVLLRVDVSVDIAAYQPIQKAVCVGVGNPDEKSICQKQYQGEHYQLCAVKEKPFTFSDQVRLQSGSGEAPSLLAARIRPVCTESKIVGSKLIFKGMAEMDLLLQEHGTTLITEHESLPFSQIIELTDGLDVGDCQIGVEVASFRCEQDPSDSRALNIDLELLAQAQVRSYHPIILLQDLYSTGYLMEVERENQSLCHLVEQSVRPQAVRELLETGEMVRSVVDAWLSFGQVRQTREGKESLLSTDICVTALYLDENELVQCLCQSIPVLCRLELPENTKCSCFCSCPGEVFATPASGGIEVRFTVEFHCLATETSSVPTVVSAQLGGIRGAGEDIRPSVVLRMPTPGEELCDIAKAHGTTMENIIRANEMDEDNIFAGHMLLIPSVR